MQNSEQGVQLFSEPYARDKLEQAAWDDLQIFRTVARSASFRQAAKTLGVSVNTVRSGVGRLEATLNTVLVMRSHDGIRVTAEGSAVLEVALEMQSLGSRIGRDLGDESVVRHGQISICCSEGIGEFWLAPRLLSLQDRLPRHDVSLHNDFNQTKIDPRNSDLSVGFMRPVRMDTYVSRLASLHFMIYASESYIARHGAPKSLNEARKHRFVVHEAPGMAPDLANIFIGEAASRQIMTTKVNTSSSLFRAIANGVGIGALPTYVRTQTADVRPLDLPIQLKFDLWLSFERAAKNSVPVRIAIDWLHECFDPKKHPWFGEDFIHPDDFGAHLPSDQASAFNW